LLLPLPASLQLPLLTLLVCSTALIPGFLAGADRLKRQVNLVARQNNALSRTGPLGPLLEAVAAVRVPAALMRDITAAINEDGELADSSSEQVRL
jgi:hypothetical protein